MRAGNQTGGNNDGIILKYINGKSGDNSGMVHEIAKLVPTRKARQVA
jgi:hypothetical protein